MRARRLASNPTRRAPVPVGSAPILMTERTTPSGPSRASRRFPLLDPLRGVAATVVVLDHIAGLKLGYFAVLVFFVISGYCITAAAEAGIERSMTIGAYMRRRLRRIYPPYLISVVFFVVTRIIKYELGGPSDLAKRTLMQWVQTLTLTQWVSLLPGFADYPANNGVLVVAAYWSLNYEEQFYLFVGLAMLLGAQVRRPLRSILLPFTVGTVGLMALFPTLVIGFFVDYWPLFGAGVAVYYRLAGEGGPRVRRALDVGLGLCFALSIGVLVLHGRPARDVRYIWEDLAVATGVALVLLAVEPYGSRLMATLPLRLLKKVGTISYSLYLIHQFNITLAKQVADRIVGAGALLPLHAGVELAVHLTLAAGFWWLFERPFLNAPLQAAAARPVAPALPA
jgi:peptidoglycan/LPS O-acetylase OafA/YrhL